MKTLKKSALALALLLVIPPACKGSIEGSVPVGGDDEGAHGAKGGSAGDDGGGSAEEAKLDEPIVLPFGKRCADWKVDRSYTKSRGKRYFVSPQGTSGAAGTRESPFGTLQACAEALSPGDTCVLRAGTYRETLEPTHSGTASAPITFEAEAGEAVFISASDPIRNWSVSSTTDGKTLYEAAMPWTLNGADRPAGNDLLFVDGMPLTEARWPNLTGPLVESTGDDWAEADGGGWPSVGRGVLEDADLAELSDAAKRAAFITVLPGARWTVASAHVADASSTALQFDFALPQETFYQPRALSRYFLFGAPELIDQPGEWARRADGTVVLFPPQGVDPNQVVVEAKSRQLTVDLRDVSYVHLVGITSLGGRVQSGDASAGIVLDKVAVKQGTHSLFQVGPWAGGPSALELRGPESVVLDSRVYGSAFGGIHAEGSNARMIGNKVTSNGFIGFNVFAMSARGANHVIFGNEVSGFGANGLVDLRQIESSLIACNDISNGGRVTTDGGLVMIARDTDGKDTRITSNYIHGGKSPYDGPNEFYGTAGFYSEQNVVGFVFDHNVIWDVTGAAVSLVPGAAGKIQLRLYNNSVDGSWYFQRQGEADFSGSDFRNNYFVKTTYGQQLRSDVIAKAMSSRKANLRTITWFRTPSWDSCSSRSKAPL